MDESHKSTIRILTAYASAMMSAQLFEGRLVFLLTFTENLTVGTPEEALAGVKETQESLEKLTLGRLKKRLYGSASLSDEQIETIDHANHIRNRLAHRFLTEEYKRIADPSSHPELRKDIQDSQEAIENAIKVIAPMAIDIVKAFAEAAGEKPETKQIKLMAEAILNKEASE